MLLNVKGMRLIHIVIVFVVIGLTTGGALALRSDPVKGILAEFEQYKSAISHFRAKYGALPGDMTNATEFWGIAGGKTGSDKACYEVNSLMLDDSTRTCNGNGNGYVFHKDNVSDQSAPEWFRAWQHLSNAGLIDGHYTGTADRKPRGATPGSNVPASMAVDSAGYTYMYFFRINHPKWFPGQYEGLAFGGAFINPVNFPVETRGGAITPAQAQALDEKMDDGSPRRGVVRSFRDLSRCIYRDDQGKYHYRAHATDKSCGLFLAFRDPQYNMVEPRESQRTREELKQH